MNLLHNIVNIVKNRNVERCVGRKAAHGRFSAVARLLCAVIILNSCVWLFASCGGRDELGNRYAEMIDGMESANALVVDAKSKSDAISNISYDVALMVKADLGEEKYDLGIKNSYFVTDRGSEESEIFCSKTYYGSEENEVDVYYRHGGYLYIDYCDTLIRSQVSEKDFYTYVADKGNTASTDFFKSSNFASGCVYEYKDGNMAAVFSAPSDGLKQSIAVFLGLEGKYMYDFSDMYLRFNVNADGTVSQCRLDFMLDYYNALSPDAVVTYDGEFACTVTGTGDGVSVRTPQAGIEYTTVSDFSKLELFMDGYEVLSSFTSVSADYYRKVVAYDYTAKYELENTAQFTQSYKDKVYTYGSIDVERGSVAKVDSSTNERTEKKTLTSVGMFVDPENKYHYRDLENNDETKDNETSVEQWLLMFGATLSEEAFFESDISALQISEEGDYITFTYEYSQDALPIYVTYLMDTFSGEQGSINVGNQVVYTSRNKGVVKIRVSDGCLVYHKVEFEAHVGIVTVSGDFELKVNVAGGDVDVLDLADWTKHEMRFN